MQYVLMFFCLCVMQANRARYKPRGLPLFYQSKIHSLEQEIGGREGGLGGGGEGGEEKEGREGEGREEEERGEGEQKREGGEGGGEGEEEGEGEEKGGEEEGGEEKIEWGGGLSLMPVQKQQDIRSHSSKTTHFKESPIASLAQRVSNI